MSCLSGFELYSRWVPLLFEDVVLSWYFFYATSVDTVFLITRGRRGGTLPIYGLRVSDFFFSRLTESRIFQISWSAYQNGMS